MVRTHNKAEPGKKLRFSDSAYQVQENGSRRKIAEMSPAEKRADKKARWKSARAPKQTAAAFFNGAPIGEVTDLKVERA
jgi:hypothetical protein